MSDDRLDVLKKIKAGQLSTDEALQLLDTLNEQVPPGQQPIVPVEQTSRADHPDVAAWWIYPTAAGAVIMAVGAPLMALGFTGRAAMFWALCCGWIPFLFGLAVLTVGVWSHSARWLHLRIENTYTGTRRVALSLPLPLTLGVWILRLIRPFVPQLNETAVDELIAAVHEAWREGDDAPIFIEVQDDDNGERVTVYVG
jgi:hypothetical protein